MLKSGLNNIMKLVLRANMTILNDMTFLTIIVEFSLQLKHYGGDLGRPLS